MGNLVSVITRDFFPLYVEAMRHEQKENLPNGDQDG